MNPELQQILESTSKDPPRSRLDPYHELILRWRRQGKSYRKICSLLAEKCGVSITDGTLCRYVRRRSRPRKLAAEAELVMEPPAGTTHLGEPGRASISQSNAVKADPYAEVRAQMARAKAESAPAKPIKIFEYTDEDSTKPIVLLSKNTKEK